MLKWRPDVTFTNTHFMVKQGKDTWPWPIVLAGKFRRYRTVCLDAYYIALASTISGTIIEKSYCFNYRSGKWFSKTWSKNCQLETLIKVRLYCFCDIFLKCWGGEIVRKKQHIALALGRTSRANVKGFIYIGKGLWRQKLVKKDLTGREQTF